MRYLHIWQFMAVSPPRICAIRSSNVVDHLRMVVEIGRLDELDLGMARRHRVGRIIDALHQNAGEQEIREDDDAPIAEPRRMFERRLDQRKGDAGIGRLGPAEAKAFPQQARDLGDIGIGVGIGGAAADDDQQRLVLRHVLGAASSASCTRSPAARSILGSMPSSLP